MNIAHTDSLTDEELLARISLADDVPDLVVDLAYRLSRALDEVRALEESTSAAEAEPADGQHA